MSKTAKLCFLISGMFFLVLGAWRLVYGGWHNAMFVPLAIIIAFFAIGAVKDGRAIVEFFTMRTTKHGLNMGALILIALVFLVSINFLAVRYDKKFDFTKEGLNSLSDQSVKAAQSLKQDVELVLLYRKEQQEENVQRNVRDLAAMYQNASKKISFKAYSALQRPDLAQQFEFSTGGWGFFAVSGPRHFKIEQPTEEETTKALIKMGRDKKKILYFTAGHGEREIDPRKAETITDLKEDLTSIYDVKTLTLFSSGNKVPDDADILAIIGPQRQFLDPELEAVRAYARRGGHLLIAIDPGQKHNLAQLTKTLGVEFENNYVLDPRANIPGAGNIAALGTEFSHTSEISRNFKSGMMTIFLLASALRKAPDASASFTIDEIVKTDAAAVSAASLEREAKMDNHGPFTLAISVTGKLPNAPSPGGKDAAKADSKTAANNEFTAVIVGDSDFMSNALYRNNLNRDLIMNSFASLSADKDLISIRPKAPKGTKLDLTRQKFVALILLFIALVIGLFFSGGFVWWRRRTA